MSAPRLLLIGEAVRKGFQVVSNEENTGYLVSVPSRLRHPANLQGEFSNTDRAWSAACLISRDYPQVE